MKTVNLMTWVAVALISWVGSAVAQTPSARAEPPEWTTPSCAQDSGPHARLYDVDLEGEAGRTLA
jgi:hypothetical protein